MENIDTIFSVHPGDDALYEQWTRNLPKTGGTYGLQAHSVKNLRKACEIHQPTSILEIGFNLGGSAAMWLNLSQANLVSVDINDAPAVREAARTLEAEYPGRFTFILSDSRVVCDKLRGVKFDMIFIDGGHEYDDVLNDITLGKRLGIKKFVFDDWLPKYGSGTQRAIQDAGLTVTHLLGENIAVATMGSLGSLGSW